MGLFSGRLPGNRSLFSGSLSGNRSLFSGSCENGYIQKNHIRHQPKGGVDTMVQEFGQ